MEIQIRELDDDRLIDIDQCDNSFWVESRLQINAKGDEITLSLAPAKAFQKRYLPELMDYSDYIDNPDKKIFLAYFGEKIAGQIILRTNWNGYAYIEDIAVDKSCRRKGIGRRLMVQAVDWARSKGLPGIMLETSNINIDACQFYENLGFKLGGFDRYLYRATIPGTEEVALYWYLIF